MLPKKKFFHFAIGMVLLAIAVFAVGSTNAQDLMVVEQSCFVSIQTCIDNASAGDVVHLPVGNFAENIVIDKDLTLIGVSRNTTQINGTNSGSVMTIEDSAEVTLIDMTLFNGKGSGGEYENFGGGIYAEADSLTLNSVTIRTSTTDVGTSVTESGGNGGGIYMDGDTLILDDVVIADNTTATSTGTSTASNGGNGAGIYFNGDVLTITDSTIADNHAGDGGGRGPGGRGGGLYLTSPQAEFSIEATTIQNNSAGAGADDGDGGHGGGLFIVALGELDISTTTFHNNTAGKGDDASGTDGVGNGQDGYTGGDGGAIYVDQYLDDGLLITIEESTFSDNSAGRGGDGSDGNQSSCNWGGDGAVGGRGGAIFLQYDIMIVEQSVFTGNRSGAGGDAGIPGSSDGSPCGDGGDGGDSGDGATIYIFYAGNLTLDNTTLSGNLSGAGGLATAGGVNPISGPDDDGIDGTSGDGGALYARGFFTLVHVTMVDNGVGAGGTGGGIYARVSGTIQNSIVAGNHVDGSLSLTYSDCEEWTAGLIASADYNLSGFVSGCGFGEANDIGITPSDLFTNHLFGLADNGGSTSTHRLRPVSSAVDAIPDGTNDCESGLSADQRGFERAVGNLHPTGSGCDIGAYEHGSTTVPTAIQIGSIGASTETSPIALVLIFLFAMMSLLTIKSRNR